MQKTRKIQFWSLIVICLTFSSCISTKKLLSPHGNVTTSSFEKRINGVYQNIDTSNSVGTSSLINVLYEKAQTKFPDDWAELQVHILYEENKLFIKSYVRDSLVYENEIWGHVHENYFVSHRKYMLIPLLLFNMAKESRQIIYIDESGILHATNRGYYWWFIAAGYSGNGDVQNYLRYGQFNKLGPLPLPF